MVISRYTEISSSLEVDCNQIHTERFVASKQFCGHLPGDRFVHVLNRLSDQAAKDLIRETGSFVRLTVFKYVAQFDGLSVSSILEQPGETHTQFPVSNKETNPRNLLNHALQEIVTHPECGHRKFRIDRRVDILIVVVGETLRRIQIEGLDVFFACL